MGNYTTGVTTRELLPIPKCCNPDCEYNASSRGLCNGCYNVLLQAVKRGETTWAICESLGMSIVSRRGKHRIRSKWELELSKRMKAAGLPLENDYLAEPEPNRPTDTPESPPEPPVAPKATDPPLTPPAKELPFTLPW